MNISKEENNVTTNKEPDYMQIILEEVERELAEEREISAREAHLFSLHSIAENKGQDYNLPVVVHDLTHLYEGLIEWTFLMDEPALSSLFLTTIPLACYVRTNANTGNFESAIYVLACEDDRIVIVADTESEEILTYSSDQYGYYLDLPFVNAIQEVTRKLYEAAIAVSDLESVIGPTGEQLKVLFVR